MGNIDKKSKEEVEEVEKNDFIKKFSSYKLDKEIKVYSGELEKLKRSGDLTKPYEFRMQLGKFDVSEAELQEYKGKLILAVDDELIKKYTQIDKQFITAWEPKSSLFKIAKNKSNIRLELANDVELKNKEKSYGTINKGEKIKITTGAVHLPVSLKENNNKIELNKYGFTQIKTKNGFNNAILIDSSNSIYNQYIKENKMNIKLKDIKGYEDILDYQYVCVFEPKYLYFYINNVQKLHTNKLTEKELIELYNLYSNENKIEQDKVEDDEIEEPVETNYEDESLISKRNRILSGAPGTGKSNELIEDSKKMNFNEVKRVTFYPTYRYGQFIGSYKPSPIYSESSETLYEADRNTKIEPCRKPIIDYKLIPGPFLDILCKSLKEPDNKYLLLIEEINRGDAASIFGDTFQLLDRDDKGTSKYGITFNEDIMNYLKTKNIIKSEIKIPDNMYIWCTMNSADDGVKKLDSAFKRRWSFEYMHLNGRKDDKTQKHISSLILKTKFKCLTEKGLSGEIYWNKLRKKINEILEDDKFNIPEDKLIGPFFLSKDEMSDEYTLINKLVMYLREDVLRYKSGELFGKNSFYNIHDLYEAGENIFLSDKISDADIESMAVKVEDSKEVKTEEGKSIESDNETIVDESQLQIIKGELNDSTETDLNSGDIDNE